MKKNPITNKLHKLYISKKDTINGLNQTILGYRHMYTSRYDLLNDDKGFGTIELFNISFRKINNKIELNQLILINLEALPPSSNFFNQLTTSAQAGSKRLIFMKDVLHTYIDYSKGYNYKLNSNFYHKIDIGVGVYYYNKDIYKYLLFFPLLG